MFPYYPPGGTISKQSLQGFANEMWEHVTFEGISHSFCNVFLIGSLKQDNIYMKSNYEMYFFVSCLWESQVAKIWD